MSKEALNAEGLGAEVATAQRRRAALARYGLAVLTVGVALGSALILEHFHFRDGAIPLLLFALAVSAWYGGRGPALLAFALSSAGFYWYFIEPVRTIYIYPSEVPYFAIFLAFSLLIAWFSTLRRRAEETLREQASLLNLTHDTVFVTDMDGVIQYWNRGAEEQYGWTAEETLGKLVHDLLKTVFPSPLTQLKAELARTDRWEGELVHTRMDGTQVVVASRWALQRDKYGKPLAILETNNDITERRRAEQSLRQSEAYLAEGQKLTHTGSWALDVVGNQYVYCSEEDLRMFGFDPREPLPDREAVFERILPEDGNRIRASFETACRERVEISDECRIMLPDGTVRHMHVIAHPVLNSAGAVVELVGTSVDITERKRAEEALRRLNRELRALSNCNQTLLRATDELSLLREICRIVCEEAGYRPVWVSYVEDDEAKTVRPVAWAGADETYLATAKISWSETAERGRGPTGTAVRSGEACCVQDFATDGRVAPWRDVLLRGGFRSGIALPLKDEQGHVFGTLTMHSAQPDVFTPEEIRLLEELAGDLAFGIITQRSRAARHFAEQEVALLSFALNSVREAALLTDDSGCILYINEAGCRVLGYTPAELLGMKVPDIDPNFPVESWPDHWRDLKAQRSLSFESHHRTRDGRTFPVEVSANYFEYGGRAYNLAVVRDITERKRNEEVLRLSNAYNRSLIEASLDPLVTIGPDGKITDVNRATEAATGCSRDELIGTDFCDYFTEPALARAGYQRAFSEGAVRDYPLELRHRDGRVASVLYNASVYRNESGNIIGVFAAARDVTERRRAEEARRRTAAYLAETQRLTHTGTFVADPTTAPLYWSEEMFRIFGFDPQDGLPSREQPLQRIHPEDLDDFWRVFQRGIHEKVEADVEFRIVLPDGTVKHAHGIGHPVLNADGESVEFVGSTVDITERKNAERALRESETRFRTFVDHAADAFFMLDFEQGTIIDVNRCACESLGYAREELIGLTPLAFDVDLDQAGLESLAERAAAGESVLSDKHWHRRKDGSLFPVGVQTSVFWHGGRRFLLKVARDISDSVRAEEQRGKLRQLEADLAHINRVSMMGELTASIAHEVNQPLAGVVSNASAGLRWLAGDPPNLEEVREGLRRIVRDGKRAGEVIARIRALTRKASTLREKLDLNETIREVLALVTDEAKKNGVTIHVHFAEGLSLVTGDHIQLQQVVLNLVMNAIEAMSRVDERPRELVITTRNAEDDQVQTIVEDSGPGLDMDAISRIFESFYSTKPGGMGMGLSISRSILEAHGGRLWVTGRDGPGASFHFTLPKYHEEESNGALA